MRMIRYAAGLGASCFALASYSAFAQATAEPSADDKQVHASIEDIVVTAERRSESLQTTPLTVNAVTADVAQSRGISRMDDLNIAVPSLAVTRTVAAPLIFMRGIGTNSATAGQEQNVAYYVDDVYYPSMVAAASSFNNIERIEVLKGPQGTLFGRNTTGGLVHIITKDPSHDAYGKVELGYANYSTISGSLYLTGGVSDSIAADVSVSGSRQYDGWGRNIFTGKEVNLRRDLSLRSKVVIEPSDRTKVVLTGDYAYYRGDIGSSRQRLPGPLLPNLPGSLNGVPLTYANAPYNGVPFDGNIYNSNVDARVEDFIKGYGFSFKIEHDAGFATLKSITAYGHNTRRSYFDTDNTPLPASQATYDPGDVVKNFSEEVHISSPVDSNIQWIAGAFYYYSKGESFLKSGSATSFVRFDDSITTHSLSGFAQVTVPLGARTNLTAGGRYTTDKKEVKGGAFSATGALLLPAYVPSSKRFNNFTFRAGIDHQFNDDVMAYANVSTGFKSGLFDLTSPHRPPADPEKLTAYEGGLKSTFADRRVRLNLAAFYYDYRDIQIRAGSTSSPLTVFLRNVGKARIWGVEGDGEVVISDSLRLTGGAAYLNSKFVDFSNIPTFDIVNGIGVGVNSPSLAGNQLPRAPKFTGNAALIHSLETDVGKFQTTLSIYHNGGFYWEPNNLLRQKSYNLANAEVRWTSNDSGWNIRLFMKNIFKEEYYIYANTAAGTPPAGAPGEPRTYGFSVGVEF